MRCSAWEQWPPLSRRVELWRAGNPGTWETRRGRCSVKDLPSASFSQRINSTPSRKSRLTRRWHCIQHTKPSGSGATMLELCGERASGQLRWGSQAARSLSDVRISRRSYVQRALVPPADEERGMQRVERACLYEASSPYIRDRLRAYPVLVGINRCVSWPR